MSYKSSKETVIKEREALFREYENFLRKTLQLSSKVSAMSGEVTNSVEARDFANFLSNDEEMKKLTRLTIALLYTENPENKEVLEKLKDDIAFAEMDTRAKNRKK